MATDLDLDELDQALEERDQAIGRRLGELEQQLRAQRRPNYADDEARGVDDGEDDAGSRERSPDPRAAREHRQRFEEWLRNPHSAAVTRELRQAEKRSYLAGTPSAGGYLVPTELEGTVLSRLTEENPMRRLCRTVNVSSTDFKLPVATSAGGVAWVGENSERTATTEAAFALAEPTFGICYAYTKVSEELIDDSAFDLGQWLIEDCTRQFARSEAEVLITGNGTNRPTGLLANAPVADADGSRTFGTLQYIPNGETATLTDPEALVKLMYATGAPYRANGSWLMNSQTAEAIRIMQDGANRYVWMESLAADQPPRLLGRPVEINEFMPDIGAGEFPILFGDFSRGYCIADSFGIRVSIDANVTEPGFVKFYIRRRLGGCVYDDHAIRALKVGES